MAKYLTDRNVAKQRLLELVDKQLGKRPGNRYTLASLPYAPDLERSRYIQLSLPTKSRRPWGWKRHVKVVYVPFIQDEFIVKLKLWHDI